MPFSTESLAGLQREAEVTLLTLNLARLGVDDTYHFANETYPDGSSIYFNEIEYQPIPFKIDGEKADLQNQLSAPTLTVGELYDEQAQLLIGSFVQQYEDLVGATITVFNVFAKHLDAGEEPNSLAIIRSETYTIERKKLGSRIAYAWELSAGNNLQGIFMNRQVTNNCSYKYYRREGCNYSGPPIEDEDGEPIVPIKVTGCTLTTRTITKAGLITTGVEPGMAVVGAGIPPSTVVSSMAADGQSVRVNKDLIAGTNITCWFAAEQCGRLTLNCKRRFGVERSGVVTPNSAVITSPSSARGQWDGMVGHFIHCSNLAAGLPVARKIISVGTATGVAITAVSFAVSGNQKRWIFNTATQLGVNSNVTIAGVHPLINGTYVLAADSFTGVGANQFAILAKPHDIASIITSPTTTTINAAIAHQLTTGNQIFIEGTNTDNGVALNGLRTITATPNTTQLVVNYGVSATYQSRNRDGFTTPAYMQQFRLGSTILNSTAALNQEGYFYFAPSLSGLSGATAATLADSITLDRPVDSSATAGTYTFIVGGEKFSGLLNFGGQIGASVINF